MTDGTKIALAIALIIIAALLVTHAGRRHVAAARVAETLERELFAEDRPNREVPSLAVAEPVHEEAVAIPLPRRKPQPPAVKHKKHPNRAART